MTTFIERWKRERERERERDLILTHILSSLKVVAILMKFAFISDQRNNPFFLSCKMDMYKYYNYDKRLKVWKPRCVFGMC
jgi:hypothetical protein